MSSIKSLFKTLEIVEKFILREFDSYLSLIEISLNKSFKRASIFEECFFGLVTAEFRITEITGSLPISLEFLFLMNDAERFFEEK